MSIKLKLCAAALLLSACSDTTLPSSVNSDIVQTPYILEAQQAGAKKFDAELSFITIYENNEAVCGDVKKDEGNTQQFIYARNTFMLQEDITSAAEWDAQWASECDDG